LTVTSGVMRLAGSDAFLLAVFDQRELSRQL
jgi:hypothetical protein